MDFKPLVILYIDLAGLPDAWSKTCSLGVKLTVYGYFEMGFVGVEITAILIVLKVVSRYLPKTSLFVKDSELFL